MKSAYYLGIDIGSTTVKLSLLDRDYTVCYSTYRRHQTEVFPVLLDILGELEECCREEHISVLFTGTAGMGVAERSGLPFVQEVAASAEVMRKWLPEVRTFIDLGGEDTKIIFFDDQLRPDIRMNGNCAGGTGAFIDQMASLLDVPVDRLSDLAKRHTACYPIASRCGVFAKTDVQNLMSRDISPENIAASVYRSVALQVVGALARGRDIVPQVLFAGGPFAYQEALKEMFMEVLELDSGDVTDPLSVKSDLTPELIPSVGAALRAETTGKVITLDALRKLLDVSSLSRLVSTSSLEPLFKDEQEFISWEKKKAAHKLPSVPLKHFHLSTAYLGIDSGSTTTKIVLIDREGNIGFSYYAPNRGNSVQAVRQGLKELKEKLEEDGVSVEILRSASTGYGEDLIKFAFSLDEGMVETMAHYRGARFFEPEVSFILDIGGQDMKALFINDGIVSNIELNESCSSGCGSFIQTFAQAMHLSVEEFARRACTSADPCDLGSRCTVFMNSKVKQVLREGGSSADISAGLAYSVIKNCLNKVLKITDTAVLGKHIVVQGGTFNNPAVLRALELVIDREVVKPDRAELMGAWGAALLARDAYEKQPEESGFIGLNELEEATVYQRKAIRCNGCENQCEVTVCTFPHRTDESGKAARFYTGNKCEHVFSNSGKTVKAGYNLPAYKRTLLFNRSMEPSPKVTPSGITIGIPRVLNMWEDFPFWCTLFTESGIKVVLSDPSTQDLVVKGYPSVMSENICYPAKITNGHIINLKEKGVDRIFFPKVRYTRREFKNTLNTFNCPVVTGYPQVIESAIDPESTWNIPLDAMAMSFHDLRLLKKRCVQYLVSLGIPERTAAKAYAASVKEIRRFKEQVRTEAERVLALARKEGRTVMLLLGRPYHLDPLVNMKIPEIITSQGLDCITEDSIPEPVLGRLPKVQVLTQWGYPNRMFYAAHWAGSQRHVEVVQTNSFGCGPDALTIDEIKAILNQYGKYPTLIKIDEMTSPGSVKLRVRSLVESMALRKGKRIRSHVALVRKELPIFTKRDIKRTVLAPQFSPFYTDFIIAAYRKQGYSIEILPMADQESIKLGLRYSNNDICYPATIVIGDVLKALRSGRYDLSNVAVGLTQTGGQCRASSYVSLMKQALIRAGYDNIPVVTASTKSVGSSAMNQQPGFRVKTLPFALTALYGMLFGDAMAKLYYYSAVREQVPGSSLKLAQHFIEEGRKIIDHRAKKTMFALIRDAVEAFNALPVRDVGSIPRVGIVGEIYVKFNPFGNLYITDWLIKRSIQPEVPPLIDFFLIPLVSTPYNAQNHIERVKWFVLHLISRAERYVGRTITQVNAILKDFRGELTPFHPIKQMAERASLVLDLINQFGESWLLAGDIVSFAEEGVDNVVCLQPFGCIANHVIAKGVERKLKQVFPQVNLLFLDMDSGMSEVNVENRMEFLIDGLRR